MIKLNTKIGKYTIQVEFKTMKDLHRFGNVYGNLPQKCDACGSDNIFLSYKNPGGNDYYTLQCGDCTADANFGIHKEDKGLFWKREKMTVYVPKEDNGVTPEQVKDELDDFVAPQDESEEAPF
jgi:hypothetical protein